MDAAGESHWTMPPTQQPKVQPEVQLEEVDLAVSLPQDWTAHTDRDSGKVYYSNAKTGQTQWTTPAEKMPIKESLPKQSSSLTLQQHQSVHATPVTVGAVERELMALHNPPANMFTVETKQKQKGLTKREALLIAALAVAVACAVALGIAFATKDAREHVSKTDATTSHTCISPSCIQLSSTVLQVTFCLHHVLCYHNLCGQNLDASVDPCEDFFEFSCGGFHKSHAISELPKNDDGRLAIKEATMSVMGHKVSSSPQFWIGRSDIMRNILA